MTPYTLFVYILQYIVNVTGATYNASCALKQDLHWILDKNEKNINFTNIYYLTEMLTWVITLII